ncbi:GAF and ANTAR domain-containing protein [Nonomuraea sp. ZG12]|uniref:GAF and ANTAR domain-containing protein n=1 Tax=Nonomuraea sp. ZG12 TaxID=3452207 RepID=UPI003F8A416C
MAREQLLARVFVELADTLVADFDVIEFLHLLTERCVQVLGVDAAGLLLTDQADHLQLVAASSEQSRILELFQLQADQGPCLDCYATGTQVAVADLAAEAARWPEFAAAAHERGFAAVHAMPMRLREQVIGALNLFSATPGGLDADSAALGQAFADVATIGLLGERAAREQTLLSQQLQIALNTRVLIEQAKGMLAERGGESMDRAFTTMRAYARANNRKLTDVAHAVINGDVLLSELTRVRKASHRAPG